LEISSSVFIGLSNRGRESKDSPWWGQWDSESL
jgi:hypothetical protein